MVKFSIIVPAYNAAAVIKDCIGSVLCQSYSDWEAICVDDGSTDETARILEECARADNRIRVIRTSNHGVSAARNLALRNVTGDWFLFLDADDQLRQDALRRILECIVRHPLVDLVRFEHRQYQNGQMCELFAGDFEIVKDLRACVDADSMATYMWHLAYKTSVLGMLRFDVAHVYAEDMLFVLEALKKSRYLCRINAQLYAQRSWNGSVTKKPLSLTWVLNDIDWHAQAIGWLKRSGRKYERGSLMWHVNLLRFWFPGVYYKLSEGDRAVAFRYFQAKVRDLPVGTLMLMSRMGWFGFLIFGIVPWFMRVKVFALIKTLIKWAIRR